MPRRRKVIMDPEVVLDAVEPEETTRAETVTSKRKSTSSRSSDSVAELKAELEAYKSRFVPVLVKGKAINGL